MLSTRIVTHFPPARNFTNPAHPSPTRRKGAVRLADKGNKMLPWPDSRDTTTVRPLSSGAPRVSLQVPISPSHSLGLAHRHGKRRNALRRLFHLLGMFQRQQRARVAEGQFASLDTILY